MTEYFSKKASIDFYSKRISVITEIPADSKGDVVLTAKWENDVSPTVPKTKENLEKLIEHLVNNAPLDGNYDFNGDGLVNGKDVILLEIAISRGEN